MVDMNALSSDYIDDNNDHETEDLKVRDIMDLEDNFFGRRTRIWNWKAVKIIMMIILV
ncbi:8932_t:CDS:2 [Entrophospora sp. SA101]|nr:8932_t:CDS:2 [Entrophospora sp. SA101]CAJ0846365.1 3942_t:CDS:2 [Entrophospora sp. SA101]